MVEKKIGGRIDDKLIKRLFGKYIDAMFILDGQGEFLAINQAFTQLLGYQFKELSQVFQEFIQKEDLEKLDYHFYKALSNKITSFDISLLHKNGDLIDVAITFIPEIDSGGVGVVHGVAKTISAGKEDGIEYDSLKQQLKLVEEESNIGSWEYNVSRSKGNWSNQVYSILQIEKLPAFLPTFKRMLELIDPKEREEFQRAMQDGIDKRESFSIAYRITRQDNEVRDLYFKGSPVLNENGEVSRFLGTVRDITEKKQEEQLQLIKINLSVGVWSYDVKIGKLQFCSRGIEKIFALDRITLENKGKGWFDYVHQEDLSKVKANYRKVLEGQEVHEQYRIINEKHEEKWIETQSTPILDMDGNVVRIDGHATDITKQKASELLLEYISNHDHVTKLPNRKAFMDKLKEVIDEEHTKFAVMYLDMDRFRSVNESLSHEIGDKVLIDISNRLKNALDQTAYLARLGGDEFAICLRDINNIADTYKVAENLIELIEKPIFIEEHEIYMTTSIGISLYPLDGRDIDSLLRHASIALHKAKVEGKNSWKVYSPSLNIESYKLFSLEKDLRKAFINQEFFIEYQPKVDTKTNIIKGAEALIRWKHPEWGVVSPHEFIPLAEDSGLSFRLSDSVLDKVCKQLKIWENQGKSLVPISVNITPNRLLKAGFADDVLEIIEETSVDPNLIELEITEETVIRNIDAAKSVIAQLREKGITFALDDFCSGYSSLSYLNELDISTVKIDKSFITKISDDNNKTKGIIRSLIILADELKVNLVAEGVETNEQLNFLRQLDCPLIQGFIYSKSIPGEGLQSLLKKGSIKPKSANDLQKRTENRRKFYRINFDYPLCARMTIVKFKGQDVKLGNSKSLIEDLSLGGIRFTTQINLPVRSDVLLEFTTKILGEEVTVCGYIVWKHEANNDLFQYGLQFITTEKEMDKFAPLFNKLSLNLKTSPILQDCSFLRIGRTAYFKGEDK
ncbi:EAL domain-containing protein [Desertibacillus haloalkaliphilus]|uniref:EAL domain-containing protein n=1 Tax=Desertibacillus haloalkaliphilus TaxID=1328930 RepID=UPI001C25E445|nr:EAL domain-containing protein [Desertibacillus haloalkaliphilus]MBU8906289.1 EAL domain-containing protein [Desertibacillus haloalkaliphilus]